MENKINYFAYAGIAEVKQPIITADKVVKAVEKYTEITLESIVLKSRLAKYTRPRHILNYLLVVETNLTLSEVGKITKRDHTSVIHSKKTIENELSYDKNLQNIISKIRESINNQ